MGTDFTTLDATAQADLVRRGEATAVELVEAAIDAAERINPMINAIIHPRYERALDDAREGVAQGPFAGVPVVIKDLGAMQQGEPYHAGTRALKNIDYRAPYDAAVVRRLGDAGFIAIGRTNTPEWGSTITTEPLAHGASRNPWNVAHSTGGSSGGSAAAVAAGIVPVGHASDGGGSIRIPSSECALVGLKPSRGRVSHSPDIDESWAGYVTHGAVARSVRDAAAVFDVLAGYEPGDPYAAPALPGPLAPEVGQDAGTLRVGFLDSSPDVDADPDCAAAVNAAAQLLESLGHHVEAGGPEAMFDQAMTDRFVTVLCASTLFDTRQLEGILGRAVTEDDLEPDNLFYGQMGAAISAGDYLQALADQYQWCRRMLSWWHPADGSSGFDLLVTPVLATPPPKLGFLTGPEGATRVRGLLQYTAQFNITGQPAISLPLHWTADGLPVGVQLVAAYGREDLLMRVAAQLEAAQPWSARRPSLTTK